MSSTNINILFILTDQQSIRAMGAYGNVLVHTPNMDAIAEQGVRFTESYCPAPVCGPSRSSLVTGRMPHEVNVHVNDVPLKAGVPTIGEIFRGAGYETAWAGKWHAPVPYPTDQSIPGFENLPAGTWLGSNGDTQVADQAIEFLRRKHDAPFFLGVSFHNPHDICHVVPICRYLPDLPHDWLDRSDLPPLPDNHRRSSDEVEFIDRARKRPYYGEENIHTKTWSETHWRSYLHAYYRLIEEVDVQVGRVTDALRVAGLEENTLVVFTSDHGEQMAAHELVVKLTLYEESAAVPLVLKRPGMIPPGQTCDHLASGIDLLPTFCDYAGITPPDMTGVSLRPAIENPSSAPRREFVVMELDTNEPDMTARMLRTPRYKYMAFGWGRPAEMLFDLDLDPGETQNLAQRAAHADELARHHELLRRWLQQTGDDFTCTAL
jgi:arylsulfatase A-like enzyme